MNPTEQARSDILSSGLSKTTIANALALLSRAHPYNGHIKLSQESLADLWGVASPGTVRHYLTILARAGIIHYSTNEFVYVDFLAWPPSDDGEIFTRGRVDLRAEGGDFTRGRVESPAADDDDFTRGRVDFTRGRVDLRAEGGDSTRGRVDENAYKELSERVSSYTPLPGEKSQSITLLTDPAIFLSRRKAEELAEAFPFETIRAFACRWFDEGRKPGDDAGLLAFRLEAAETIPPLSRNELYQRHRTPAEIAADEAEQAEAERLRREFEEERERRNAEAEHRRAEQEQAHAPAPQPGDIWQTILADLRGGLPAPTFDRWLVATRATYADGQLTIQAADAYAREWLHNRLLPQIQRTAARVCGRAVEVIVTA